MNEFRVHDAVDDLAAQARTTLESLDAQEARIAATREAIRTFLASLRAAPAATISVPAPEAAPPPPVEVRPKPSESRPKPGPKKRTRSTVPCPKCGFQCSPQNMWRHDKSAHGPTGQPAEVPKAKLGRPAAGSKILACSECDATFPVEKASEMSRHTITAHKRGPLLVERTPVAA